ncbi:MAG TPA: hypothetical protein VK177_06785 [Flavobacteriales bacterium]|nr:hypothetical protein [Flavobacteriales bacterium]
MKKLLVIILTCSCFCTNAQNNELIYTYDKQNVVASKLIGTWKIDVALTTLLLKTDDKENTDLRDKKQKKEKEKTPLEQLTIEFTKDTTVVGTLPPLEKNQEAGLAVYLSGYLTVKEKKYPFILVEHRGNMQVVWYRERDGNPLRDTESFIVTIAAAKEKYNDLLFIGGDFNNQPFKAFKREK